MSGLKDLTEAPFPFDFEPAYRAEGWRGIAFRADDYEVPTGRIEAHMIGDDRTFSFEPDELTAIPEEDYCPGCGQIGCGAYH